MSDSHFGQLTDEQIEAIAERAADKAVAKLTSQIYQEVGRNVVSKLVWLLGVIAVGGYLWLSSKGIVK